MGRKEYVAIGAKHRCGPGGPDCSCCNPSLGSVRSSEGKTAGRRAKRRVEKHRLKRELATDDNE